MLLRLKVVLLALLLIVSPAFAAQTNMISSTVIRVSFKSVNLNSAGSDNLMTIPYAKYIVRRVTVTNASTSLAASSATLGVFTSTGGGGTTVVTAATLTALSAASKFVDMTVALSADTTTSSTLYARNVIAHGSAATVDVHLDLQPIP